MTKKYDKLDDRILECVAMGPQKLGPILSTCTVAAWAATAIDKPVWRTIQSRLQVLRKEGKI